MNEVINKVKMFAGSKNNSIPKALHFVKELEFKAVSNACSISTPQVRIKMRDFVNLTQFFSWLISLVTKSMINISYIKVCDHLDKLACIYMFEPAGYGIC